MGVPAKAATPNMAMAIPRYVPIWLDCGVTWAKHGDIKKKLPPEKNPYRMAKTLTLAFDDTAGQHNSKMPLHVPSITKVLYRPILSATTPGKDLPNTDAAFKMESMYEARSSFIPCCCANCAGRRRA
ncbi:hypothetical protein J3459_013828 [Metarhizium acridum]|nr:hypothetical protein J3459_013828 [Metarhizium acridum]